MCPQCVFVATSYWKRRVLSKCVPKCVFVATGYWKRRVKNEREDDNLNPKVVKCSRASVRPHKEMRKVLAESKVRSILTTQSSVWRFYQKIFPKSSPITMRPSRKRERRLGRMRREGCSTSSTPMVMAHWTRLSFPACFRTVACRTEKLSRSVLFWTPIVMDRYEPKLQARY